MQLKHVPYEYSKALHWSDIVTSIYLLLFLSFLYYSNHILKVGCLDNIYIVLSLAVVEVAKYVVCITRNKSLIRKSSAKEFFKSIVVIILAFIVIYVIAVLFGAPALSDFQETCMFSLILTTVTALPLCMHLGSDTTVSMFLSLTSYEGDEIHKLFMLKVRLALFGAWLGAVVIPLDWNRPWQDWPIPCCIGTLIGYLIANCISSLRPFRYCVKPTKKTGKYTL